MAERPPRHAAEPLVIALHVPKCAGATVEGHLRHHLGPAFWSAPKRSRHLPLGLFARKHAPRPPVAPREIRAVSGHWIGGSVAGLFPGRRVHRSVLLREPAALLLSWYNYRMSRYRAAGRGTYPFALHLASLPPDPVAHFLLERWGETPWPRLAAMGAADKRRRLDGLLAPFDRVGDVSECDALVGELSAFLGVPDRAARVNVGAPPGVATDWVALGRADLDAPTREMLHRRTRLDDWLWRRWALGQDATPEAPMAFLAAEIARPRAEIARRLARGR